MSGKFFLDTNIFIYSFDRNSAKARRAAELIREGITTRKGIVSYQVVQEFFNVALRRLQPPLTAAEAEQYLTTVFRPMLSIHSSPALFAEALQLSHRYRINWYDSIIIAAALESQCSTLLTEDLNHGQRFGHVQVQNPFL
jgi:predicted nucleic acid-binding protein